jgi:hypothetical protein
MSAPMRVFKPRRQRHALLNKAQAQELNKARQICNAASSEEFREVLAARGITQAFVACLAGQIESCRQKSSEALQQTMLKENLTAEERMAKKALIKSITEIQSAAKQKYARSFPLNLQDYCVGKDLDASRAGLEQYSRTILQKLGGDGRNSESPAESAPAADTLPGITEEKIEAVGALRSRWLEIQARQANSQALATGLRAQRDALVASITDLRIQIQFAAEAEWPASEPQSGEKRRAFLLQPNRPFSLAA